MSTIEPATSDVATLGGGCFWCLEAAFEQVLGVMKVESGYAGGNVDQPTYEQVCRGTTGHAEVVQVTFDPRQLTYTELLTLFFTIHDPTTLNRQGADVGTQYRSVVFYHSSEQERQAKGLIDRLTAERIWPKPIVTELEPLARFWPAEGYHQGYFRANPYQPYCQAVVAPKVAKIRKAFAGRLKD